MDRSEKPAVNYRISLAALEASARPEPEEIVATHPVPEAPRPALPGRSETIERLNLIAIASVGGV